MEIESDDMISSLEKIPKKLVAKKGTSEPSANSHSVESKK